MDSPWSVHIEEDCQLKFCAVGGRTDGLIEAAKGLE